MTNPKLFKDNKCYTFVVGAIAQILCHHFHKGMTIDDSLRGSC